MGQNVIDAINSFSTYKFDPYTKKVINKRLQDDTNIEEFLEIQHILDKNRVLYQFSKNFEIEIVSK